MKAAAERQLAVAALQKKYEQSESIPTEQLVLDMQELWSTERVVLDAIITLFVKLGHDEESAECANGIALRRRQQHAGIQPHAARSADPHPPAQPLATLQGTL
jgi:hypothetical protein